MNSFFLTDLDKFERKESFFGRFRPQTKKNQTVLSACGEVGHLMVLNLTVLKQPDSRMQSRLMFTNSFITQFT